MNNLSILTFLGKVLKGEDQNWCIYCFNHFFEPLLLEGLANPSSLHCCSSGCRLPGTAPKTLREPSNPRVMWCIYADASSNFLPSCNDRDRNFFERVFWGFLARGWSSSAAFRKRSVAASHESSCLCASVSCSGSSLSALKIALTKPSLLS